MIICHCNRVTDRTIRAAVRDGAACAAEVSMACRAGRGCGGCVPAIDEIIDAERQPETAAALGCAPELAAAS